LSFAAYSGYGKRGSCASGIGRCFGNAEVPIGDVSGSGFPRLRAPTHPPAGSEDGAILGLGSWVRMAQSPDYVVGTVIGAAPTLFFLFFLGLIFSTTDPACTWVALGAKPCAVIVPGRTGTPWRGAGLERPALSLIPFYIYHGDLCWAIFSISEE
jgi:hypothetical protein